MARPNDKYPPSWQDGPGAFGRLYGSTLATQTSKHTAEFLTEAAFHYDARYYPSHSDWTYCAFCTPGSMLPSKRPTPEQPGCLAALCRSRGGRIRGDGLHAAGLQHAILCRPARWFGTALHRVKESGAGVRSRTGSHRAQDSPAEIHPGLVDAAASSASIHAWVHAVSRPSRWFARAKSCAAFCLIAEKRRGWGSHPLRRSATRKKEKQRFPR